MKNLHEPSHTVLTPATKPFNKLLLHQERIAGKKAILVLDKVDSHPDLLHIVEMHLPKAHVKAVSLTDFVNALGGIDADLVFIHNPRNLRVWMPQLVHLMPEFRANNPKSVVLITHAHVLDTVIHEGIEKLHATRCIDHVEPDPVLFGQFLFTGVALFTRKQELQ